MIQINSEVKKGSNMKEKQFMKAMSKLIAKSKNTFIINEDGTIKISEPSYDISAINDYITMLIHREQETAERSFKYGEAKGYTDGRRDAQRYYELQVPTGEASFIDRKTKYIVGFDEKGLKLYRVHKNNLVALQQTSLSEVYR